MKCFLKRLELNGFKSFPQKTILEFPNGITAIVGPNGSGKSNIIDAVRWILGEREAKNLRGAKVEDLIFAGTLKRLRLGQAAASLYFENLGKFLPVDFNEVVVTRQVARDGASRYFLNKSEVRLKDIVDFFAKARLGTKGLVIVSQGNSDLFVSASPPVRREMVEEMLGLREYQIKKTEAERRLKHSEINLEKVKALIQEVLPHLRSLKRQASKWEKRSEIEQELKELEDKFFGFQLKELKKEVIAVLHELKKRESSLNKLQGEKKQALEHLKEVEAKQPKERAELVQVRDMIQELAGKRSKLQKEIGRLEAQLEIEKGPSASPTPSANKVLALVQKIRDTLQESIDLDFMELRATLIDLMHEIDESFDDISNSLVKDESGKNLKGEFEEVKKTLGELENEISILQEKEKGLEVHQEKFYEDFKKAVGAVETIKSKIERFEAGTQQFIFAQERSKLRQAELEKQIMQMGRKTYDFGDYAGKPLTQEELGEFERRILKCRGDLASIGEIDKALLKETQATEERYAFLGRQAKDLEKAEQDLKRIITDLGEKIRDEFSKALSKINSEFNKFFYLMFSGGHASLKFMKPAARKEILPDEEKSDKQEGRELAEDAESQMVYEGIEISVSLPRKKISSLEMLSGGERSLVGIAALFALISVSPPPFLVLDEIDAALDDRNARRFAEMLKTFSHETQFIVVTHNRATMEIADILYGVTMGDDGTSKILSLKLKK